MHERCQFLISVRDPHGGGFATMQCDSWTDSGEYCERHKPPLVSVIDEVKKTLSRVEALYSIISDQRILDAARMLREAMSPLLVIQKEKRK